MQLFNTFNPKVFDNYVPYVGATMDLYLGSKNILTTGTLGAGATTVTTLNATTSLTIASLNGMLKASSGLVSVASAGSDYDNYWTRTGTVMTTRTPTDTLTIANLTDSGLTDTRIPYASTGGLLIDSANLTFNGSLLNLTGNMGINTPALAVAALSAVNSGVAAATYGIFGQGINTKRSGTPVVTIGTVYGLYFDASWIPSSTLQSNATSGALLGVRINLTATNYTGETKNTTITSATGFEPYTTLNRNGTGTLTVTNSYQYKTREPSIAGGTGGSAVITNLYGFYDPGLTVGATNWGIAINTQSYINAALSLGKNTAPAVGLILDSVGAIQTTTTIEAGTNFRCNTVAGITDSAAGTIVDVHATGGIVTAVTRVTPAADGTYVTGLKLTPVTGTDGSITITNGVITAITAAT